MTPIVQFNGGETGGLLFPLQDLMGAYGSPTPINNWIFQKRGARIDTAANLRATQHLQRWIKAGYFNNDANATDYFQMMSKFQHGEGLLIFDGDWESGNFDTQQAGKIGFFLTPPLKKGGRHAAMSAPLTFGIAAKAKHPRLCCVFLELGRDQLEGASDQRDCRGLESQWTAEPSDPEGEARFDDVPNTCRWEGGRQAERRYGFHRERDRFDLRTVVDTRGPEALRGTDQLVGRPEVSPGRLRKAGGRRFLTLVSFRDGHHVVPSRPSR